MSEIKYPNITVNIIGRDGNGFYILGVCQKAMRRNHFLQSEIDLFMKEATSGDYNHLLATVMAWFDIE